MPFHVRSWASSLNQIQSSKIPRVILIACIRVAYHTPHRTYDDNIRERPSRSFFHQCSELPSTSEHKLRHCLKRGIAPYSLFHVELYDSSSSVLYTNTPRGRRRSPISQNPVIHRVTEIRTKPKARQTKPTTLFNSNSRQARSISFALLVSIASFCPPSPCLS